MGNDISVVELRSMNNDQIHRFAALVNEPENTLANMVVHFFTSSHCW